jgi:hypothetical protein
VRPSTHRDTWVSLKRSSPHELLVVVSIRIEDASGRPVHDELVPVSVRIPPAWLGGSSREVMHWTSAFLQRYAAAILDVARASTSESGRRAAGLFRDQVEASARREQSIAAVDLAAAPPLVQVGLFDRRAVSAAGLQQQVAKLRSDECRSRLLALQPDAPLLTTARIVGIADPWLSAFSIPHPPSHTPSASASEFRR